ncbi:MAG: asparagine synthetase B [Candidatus Eisenbacteria sp.]|nr:asparagine synthetase B [Candidatus Eisenbacteria bacterium]
MAAILLTACVPSAGADRILVYMDLEQADHLKAYGLAYWCLEQGLTVEWLLNYRCGSFLLDNRDFVARAALLKGVSFSRVTTGEVASIHALMEEGNMEVVLLEKSPAVAIYAPPEKEPWDDAVMLALEYAEIPYRVTYDVDVLSGGLEEFDWIHLHHEDFTGQFGKFYASFRNAEWYRKRVERMETRAGDAGFPTVTEHKKAVARGIKDYISRGGFLFAMCSGTDSFDIALAAEGIDIVESVFDGDPPEAGFQQKLDFRKCLAFEGFSLITDSFIYEFSDIDQTTTALRRGYEADYFTLFDFSAKYDPVPSMLTQSHVSVINGFLGQTTSFKKSLIKDTVVILGEVEGAGEVKYLHGNYGKGTFTFYGGHDPEDYQHMVGDPPTDLSLHRNSPGYRLILNNILFPAAKKKERKT